MGSYVRECSTCGAVITMNTTAKTIEATREIGSSLCQGCRDWITSNYTQA